MIAMSPNRLVMMRWFGLPLTLLNRIGQPPSMCFCRPVTCRSGSTSLSVSISSPEARSHSSVERRSKAWFGVGACVVVPCAVAVALSAFPLHRFLSNYRQDEPRAVNADAVSATSAKASRARAAPSNSRRGFSSGYLVRDAHRAFQRLLGAAHRALRRRRAANGIFCACCGTRTGFRNANYRRGSA